MANKIFEMLQNSPPPKKRRHSEELQATCSCTDSQSCNWTYGGNGAGENNEIPVYTCCDGPYQKQFAPRSFGLPYIEADSTSALVVYKIKVKFDLYGG